ncbi:MAG: hypothetical protein A2451_14140 [Bdellovibrionales bacterium RIFOXYC2_FULL_39_8]|nr:MAG: hypothetical protein A2451_14140 [Bdellovibrionales bacterium RIFOXYC2_FULL_39_8]
MSSSSWQIYWGILLLTSTTILGILYAVSLGKSVGHSAVHLVDSINEIKFHLATTQQILYEMLYEKNELEEGLPIYHNSLKSAETYADSLLTGNFGVDHEELMPLTGPELRAKALYLHEMVLQYKTMLSPVRDLLSLQMYFKDSHEEMHDRYRTILELVNELEANIHVNTNRQLELLTYMQFVLLVFSIGLAISIIAFSRFNARKINEYIEQLFLFQDELTLAKNEAEVANRTKSDFLAHVGHEIRTPMNAILGMSEVLLDSGLSKEQNQYVKTINNAGSVLLALINDLLDLSKIESGHLHIDNIKFSPAQVASQVQELMQKGLNDKGLELLVSVAPQVRQFYAGDPARLLQILINLVGNAIKFTEKGSITIGISLKQKVDEYNDELLFWVRDTGMGIRAENLGKIFESFVQADNSIFKKYGGTGLGLAICKKLVTLMGGEIWVESKPEEGSTFFFNMPLPACLLQNGDDLAVAPIKSRAVQLESLKILLVDDSADNRLIIKTFLKKYPFEIDEAADGREGLELFTHKEYDIVFMDMNMPVLDGYEATKIIRKWEHANQKRHCPILALTAYGLKAELERSLAVGCDDYLTKPLRKETLLKYIEKFLN